MSNIKVKNLGIYKPKQYGEFNYEPIDFDIAGRWLWLDKIQPVNYKEVGSSNYTYDQIGTYNLLFHITPEGRKDKSYNLMEECYCLLQVEAYEWCRPGEMIAKDLLDALGDYPILCVQEVVEAFKQRYYYMDNDIKFPI